MWRSGFLERVRPKLKAEETVGGRKEDSVTGNAV